MEIQISSLSAIYILQECILFCQKGGAVYYSHVGWYPYETGKANKKCLNYTYSSDRVGKNLSDMFPIRNGLKQGDGHSPLLFNFTLEYAIRRI